MIKIDLVTGFLGSGKSTFIKKYVGYLVDSGLRVGILENDHGAVNVDMLVLNELRSDRCELEMVAGGCDDDCHRRRFKTKLISMAMSGYDRVVVEPSGVFDVDEFFDILRDEPLDNWYEIGNVFAIADPSLGNDISEEADYMLASQVANAGMVVYSRIQLFPDAYELCKRTTEHINTELKSINCRRTLEDRDIFAKDWSRLTKEDFDILINAGVKMNDYTKKYHMSDISFETLCLLEPGIRSEDLEGRVRSMFGHEEYGNIIRIKGYVPKDGGWLEINATADTVDIKTVSAGQNVCIVIGENLNETAIKEALI